MESRLVWLLTNSVVELIRSRDDFTDYVSATALLAISQLALDLAPLSLPFGRD